MRGGIKLGSILGIPIRIDYSWFIIFGLISFSLSYNFFQAMPNMPVGYYIVLGLIATVLFFASVLLHELAHSYVALRKGMEVSGITLFVFGGVSMLEGEPKSPRDEFQIAFVGPLTSLVLGAILLAIGRLALPGPEAQPRPSDLMLQARILFNLLGVINLALGIFNLIPGFPLDGGRVFRSLVWHITGSFQRASNAATIAGQVFGYLLIGLGIISFFGGGVSGIGGGIWWAFIGWFLLNAAQSYHQQVETKEELSGVTVGDLPLAEFDGVAPEMSVQTLVDEHLLRRSENMFPVIADNKLLGAVGIQEVQKVPRQQWPYTTVGEIARSVSSDEIVGDNADAWDAISKLGQTECECLMVTHDDAPRGILTRESIIRWLQMRRGLGLTA